MGDSVEVEGPPTVPVISGEQGALATMAVAAAPLSSPRGSSNSDYQPHCLQGAKTSSPAKCFARRPKRKKHKKSHQEPIIYILKKKKKTLADSPAESMKARPGSRWMPMLTSAVVVVKRCVPTVATHNSNHLCCHACTYRPQPHPREKWGILQ